MFIRLTTQILALILAALLWAGGAKAAQVYRVELDTAALAGTAGYLDLQFNPAQSGLPAATAEIWGLEGAGATGAAEILGDVAEGPASVLLGNAQFTNLWTLPVDFGSRLGFNVAFSGDWESAAPGDGLQLATSLYASLLDLDYGQLLTADPAASVLRMDLFPGGMVAVDLSGAAPGVAAVAAVPEPESAAMVLAGLGLLGLMVRRRR